MNAATAGPEGPTDNRLHHDSIQTDLGCGMGAMRRVMLDAAEQSGVPMKDLTVLSAQVDPFRIDTPARHRDAQWLADAATQGLRGRKIHLRGLHYVLTSADVTLIKPDGTAYVNDDANWAWLEAASKAARWLGYIGFDQITDRRNDEPLVQLAEERVEPWQYINVGVDVDVPATVDINPSVGVLGFTGRQPYRIVLAGEKSSLGEVLAPIADRYDADLYLPAGEMSDTMIHGIAQTGAADGRPVVVLYFADCDPAGWQMPISVARKLQALSINLYPDLAFQVHRVGLTPDQVRQYELPSSPLKATESRATKWRHEMGVEQTEIDALAALRPDLLRQIATDAISPFYDGTLDHRVDEARREWQEDAQARLDDVTDPDQLDRLRRQAEDRLAELRDELDAINDALQVDASDFDLPPVPPIPNATIDGDQPLPLIDSRWSFGEQSRRLVASKAYRGVTR